MNIKQRMIIYWTIRYYCQTERRVKRRILFLDTDSMPMDIRFAFMFRVDAENLLVSLDLRNYKKFFIEVEDFDYHGKQKINDFTSIHRTAGEPHYFETESGGYLPEWELERKMGKQISTSSFLKYTNRYLNYNDRNTDIVFSPDEIRQLQIFTSNYSELKKNQLKSPSLRHSGSLYSVSFKNTEIELRAYVLIFRKIYSNDKRAGGSFPDLCEAIKTHKNTALALLAEDSLAYFNDLSAIDIRAVPNEFISSLGAPCIYQLFENHPFEITVYDLVQLFFYTQFHHNPHSGRAERLQSLQSFLKRRDANDILKYIFFMALLTFQQLFFDAGQSFVGAYKAKEPHLKNPVKILNLGERSATTEDLQKRSKFEEIKRSFAHALWLEAGRPTCGEYTFEEDAEQKLLLGLGRIRV